MGTGFAFFQRNDAQIAGGTGQQKGFLPDCQQYQGMFGGQMMSGQNPDEGRVTLVFGSPPLPKGQDQEQDTHHGAQDNQDFYQVLPKGKFRRGQGLKGFGSPGSHG